MTNLNTVLKRWADFDNVGREYLQPIETQAQYNAALELLEATWERVGENLQSPYAGLLNLLTERIQHYEDLKFPIPDAPAHKMLEFLMRQHQLTQTALAAATGIHQSNLSAILKTKRQLNLEQVKVLAGYFKVNPTCFL